MVVNENGVPGDGVSGSAGDMIDRRKIGTLPCFHIIKGEVSLCILFIH
jgi:hypothetical protein